jgi:hypothetical protein
MSKIEDDAWRVLIALLVIAGIGGFVFLIGYQSYWFLRTGNWIPMGIIDGLIWAGSGWSWLMFPTEWLGLHSLINKINAGFALFLIASLVASIADQLHKERKDAR